MTYIIFSVISAFLFALTFLLRKLATKTISLQSALFFEVFIEFALLAIVFFLSSPEFKKGIDFRSNGILISILTGVVVTIGVITNYLAVKSGFLSKVVTITSPSQIIFGVILGLILLGETLTFKQILGFLFGIIGIILTVV
jgi:uncharacterized membrane protein